MVGGQASGLLYSLLCSALLVCCSCYIGQHLLLKGTASFVCLFLVLLFRHDVLYTRDCRPSTLSLRLFTSSPLTSHLSPLTSLPLLSSPLYTSHHHVQQKSLGPGQNTLFLRCFTSAFLLSAFCFTLYTYEKGLRVLTTTSHWFEYFNRIPAMNRILSS